MTLLLLLLCNSYLSIIIYVLFLFIDIVVHYYSVMCSELDFVEEDHVPHGATIIVGDVEPIELLKRMQLSRKLSPIK
jgi:hypothetical protein